MEDLYTLMCMRVEGGRTAFEREKQNSPINPDLCEWPESYFDETIWFDAWPANLAVKTMALDPSKGSDSRRGDYSALVVLGVDRQGMLYVEADLARRPTPEMVADGAEWFRRHRPDVFGVEANQFQDLLAGEFESEFRRQGILAARPVPIENHTSKQVRIRRLGPYLVVASPAFQDRQSRHEALGRAAPRVSHRRPRRRPRRPGNGVAAGDRSLQRPRGQRRPRQPAAGGVRRGIRGWGLGIRNRLRFRNNFHRKEHVIMPSTDTIERTEEQRPAARQVDPRLTHLERRLVEAFDELWSSFVDPAEPVYDVDGTAWNQLGGGLAGNGAASVPFRNEQELAAIRNECRTLAVANEFAINGHENRISYIVGSGHTYRAVAARGGDGRRRRWCWPCNSSSMSSSA